MRQANAAAHHLAGRPAPKSEVPWFWTIQYGVRFQTAGVRRDDHDIVIRGNADSGRFSVLYLENGKLAALDTVHALRDFTAGKRLIAERAVLNRSRAADPAIPLAAAAEPSA